LYASHQSDETQKQRQSWTSSMVLSVDEPQTAGLVIQLFWTVAQDISLGHWDQSAV